MLKFVEIIGCIGGTLTKPRISLYIGENLRKPTISAYIAENISKY